ncbi:MAG: matrixin family metalloprotease [Acidobacteria bacterium]|nr:matrixin family metalloprotease [Acidobacteriota bacterium]
MKRGAGILTASILLLSVDPAAAYLHFGVRVGGQSVTLKWRNVPVRYFVADAGAPGVSPSQLKAAVDASFQTWQDIPTSGITFQFVGFTSARPFDDDGMSTLGFLNVPELDRVLGATNFLISTTTGEILESDIFFNTSFSWSVAPAGEPPRFDLQTVATHEIGHMAGLGHSALGETEPRAGGGHRVIAAETVMFPIAFSPGDISDRSLRADDVAGISDLYPDGTFASATGSITGRVTKDGAGVLGAHVVAYNLDTGTLVAGFSNNRNGDFAIFGLDPGPHVIRVEPIDDADLESFFSPSVSADVSFRITFLGRFVVVPRGGSSEAIEIQVVPK